MTLTLWNDPKRFLRRRCVLFVCFLTFPYTVIGCPTSNDMKRYSFINLLPGILIFAGCSEPEVPKRQYQEFIVDAPPPAEHATDDPHHHAHMTDIPLPAETPPPAQSAEFEWDTPEEWREEAGAGMRLATLLIDADTEQAECTLIVLGGDTGGLQANIERWMEQAGIDPPYGDAMRAYVDGLEQFETAGGDTGLLVDFDPFVDDASATSTLVGIIERGEETLFVRLTGSKGLLASERERFISLCKSIR